MTPAPHIRRVTLLDMPELRAYRTLRRPLEHFQEGIFVAEGEKVVRRLLESEISVVSTLVTQEWYEALLHEGVLERKEFDIFVAEGRLLQQIVGYNLHQGIMAIGRIPPECSFDEAIGSLPSSHLLVALDGLSQAENVGVIARNCAAFGVHALIAGETSCSPYLRRAVRNSMGGVFTLRVMHVAELRQSLMTLQTHCGTRVIATDPHARSLLSATDLTGNVCIVLGNEDRGVSPGILALSDVRSAIPMHNATDSLNVASAGAVCLYEASRQRTTVT